MGGTGKSALALEYAYEHVADYDVIWWINAANQTEVHMSFKGFADRKGLINQYEPLEEEIILGRVHNWLSTHARWLFIFDNADAKDFNKWLKAYLPRSCMGDVIVTTQSTVFPDCKKVGLAVFDELEALEFLEKRTGRIGDAGAKDLAVCLGYFPLALEQAAAYLVATNHSMTYKEYIEKYEEKLVYAKGLTHYDKSIYATLQMSMDKLEQEGAVQMLNLCAYFAPDRIPMSLFIESNVFSEMLKVDVDVHDVVAELGAYSLLAYLLNFTTQSSIFAKKILHYFTGG
jgi:hypothetical protein